MVSLDQFFSHTVSDSSPHFHACPSFFIFSHMPFPLVYFFLHPIVATCCKRAGNERKVERMATCAILLSLFNRLCLSMGSFPRTIPPSPLPFLSFSGITTPLARALFNWKNRNTREIRSWREEKRAAEWRLFMEIRRRRRRKEDDEDRKVITGHSYH